MEDFIKKTPHNPARHSRSVSWVGHESNSLNQRVPAPTSMNISGKPSRPRKKPNIFQIAFYATPLFVRVFVGVAIVVLLAELIFPILVEKRTQDKYDISEVETSILTAPIAEYADKLVFDESSSSYKYNEDYIVGESTAGDSFQPKIQAEFGQDKDGVVVLDPQNEVRIKFVPQFGVSSPHQDQNRIIYPIKNKNATKVYTLGGLGIKEDIILHELQGKEIEFKYKMELSPGTEAKLESDGSIYVYGADPSLLGNVSTGGEEDAALLEKARGNADKKTLLFKIPTPVIIEQDKKISTAKAEYLLDGDELTVKASDLDKAKYPLSIDPSVYVETAAKLMRGNNETNIDFDIDNELIQKSQTTGARIDSWNSTMALTTARFDGGAVAAGGYIYDLGGEASTAAPVTSTFSSAGATTFDVPTGITSITVKLWGGGGGGGGGGTSGIGGSGGGGAYATTNLTVTPGETLNVIVGGGGGAGDWSSGGSGTLSGDGGGGGGHSEVNRSGTPLIIGAGGGGGGGGDNSTSTAGGDGGPGGDDSNGVAGTNSSSAGGGGAASSGSGGSGGTGGDNSGSGGGSEAGGDGADGRDNQGSDGSKNNGGTNGGGDGGNGDENANGYGGGGGGGGGYYGGGGGSGSVPSDAGGGGGGSGTSYLTGSGSSTTVGSGTTPGNSGDGDRAGAGDGGGGGATSSSGSNGSDGIILITYYSASGGDSPTYVRSNGSTGTSTTLDIGTAGTDRLVVVMLDDESAGTNLSNVTVDSNDCNLITIAENTVSGQNHSEMWYCDEDDLGSSNGSVNIDATGGDSGWAIHAHLYTSVDQGGPNDFGIDDTSVSTNTTVVNNIDVSANGLVVMSAGHGSSGSWNDGGWTSPLTERTDSPNPSSAVFGTASEIESSAQSNKTYTATSSVTHNRATGIVASWDATSTGGITYVGSNGSTGTSTTLDIGTAGTDRLVVVMLDDESNGTNLTGVTVDSNDCNLVTVADNSTDATGNHSEMWYCDEDDLGSSNGSVSIAATGGDSGWAIHAHLYTGVDQGGPNDFGIDDTSSSTDTAVVNNIDVSAGGVVIMAAGNGQSGTWNDGGWTSPLTERTDSPNPDSAVFGTASGIESSAQTNKTYTATASGTHNRASGIVGSWDQAIVEGGSGEPQRALYWAKFNNTTRAIESTNPGDGACATWCTDEAYELPQDRSGFSMVAYNGFLYVTGGLDASDTRQSTVYIAKLGANGEPQLWHPTDTNKANWVYWYSDSGLNGATARSYHSAVAYNNRMYILGGQTNASTGGVTTVEYADIRPNGTLGSWTSGTALPSVRHGQSVQQYNDVLYLIGGNSNGTLQSGVSYVKINTDGSMNSWQSTNGFTTARTSMGGSFTAIYGAYIYLGGGCSAVNGSGYCTTISGDMQIASINADGSLDIWSSLGSLDNTRIGYSLVGWQGGLYRLGGCSSQDSGSGLCLSTLDSVDYGVINPAGEVSTVSISVQSGTSPCSGGSPYGCDLPPPGDDAGEGGQLLTMSVILNGYLYVIGGCIDYDCQGTNPAGDDADVTGNISYVSVDSSGNLTAPGSCSGTSYGAWCVDSSNRINGTTGVAAGGITTFNNRIYVVGGLTGSGLSTNIYYIAPNTNGSLPGAWSSVDMTTAGIAEDVAYTYAYSRANPASAGTNPGNLYLFGGCGNNSGGAGCGGSDYETEVYKCNITTTGNVSGCTTSGQLQIDADLTTGGNQGLGIHSGTVYANYIYLIGGFSTASDGDKDDTYYARFDNSNNVVAVSGGVWTQSPEKLSVGRRRGWAFGYNGHIYSVGGYDDTGTGIIPFIEWSKMNVSDGSIDEFVTSSVTINQRWGLSMVVSNSFAYVIGGCDVGTSPSGCSSFEPSVQTFQLYNNDSGAINDYTAQSDQTFSTATNRWGVSSAVVNGYLYVAGGCTSATDCTAASNSTQYAPISASDGSIGTWAAGGNLPAVRAWGSLEAAGGTLYYMGGQDSTATNEQSTVYYTTSISSGNPTWGTASNGLPAARTKFGSAVWNNRLYVVGGLNGSAAAQTTVYVSPQLNSGGNITSAWSSSTAFNVARSGAAVTAYANNLYLFGGYTGSQYLSDTQFTQINSDGTVDAWTYSTSLPGPLREAQAVSANGYIYLVGGRSAATTCPPNTIITPISANTTIASGNNPTGIGEWYETNVRYTGDRYGAAVAYDKGKIYTMGGGCTSPLSSNRHYYSTVKSQPQVAAYSRMIDTDTDVFPNSWLLNGLDNSIGARWQTRYRSMNDTDGVATDCGTADMTTWGQETNFGDTTLGDVNPYVPRDGSGTNINCARYFYFYISIDASKTFGYPEDVNRGPTITDLSLFFTADPSKRLRHGKTFTGGEQQPLDTPCRQSVDADCPLP